jgi:iron complex transport system ATP-binding protein
MWFQMLSATDVSFRYGRRKGRLGSPGPQRLEQFERAGFVLDRVSVEIARGAIVGLLGPNGSGKTTLLRILGGILRPASGSVRIDGRPVSHLSRRELARRVAIVPQETHATYDFTVLDMVLMGRYPHLGSFQLEGAADLQIAREALASTGTAAFATRAFATLSGGEKQRVVIASALAQGSDILLLDEPTAALDLRYQFEVSDLLRRLNTSTGTTMIVSTHDLNVAAALCDRVVLLKEGRVIAQGATNDTLTAANIRSLYDVDAEVQFHPVAGHVTVVPIGRS